MAIDNEFYEDKFKPLQQYGTYEKRPPVDYYREYDGSFRLRLERNFKLVVIQLDGRGIRGDYLHQHIRLYQHLRELKTFCTDSFAGGESQGCVIWVCRAVMTLPYMTIKALGLTLIHEMRGQVNAIDLYNGNGAHVLDYQNKVNDLENFIKQYGIQKVTTPEQLEKLVDKFIGGPERTISKTDQDDSKATNDKATTTEANPEAEGEAQTDILNDDVGIEVHLPEEAKKIVPSKPLSRLFPPIGEINVIAGQENSGKTSLIINEVVNVTKNAEAVGAKNGVNVLVMSYDLRYEFLSQYLLAYQCGPNRVIVVDRPKSWECIEGLIEKYYVNALVLDSMLDFFSTYSPLFLGASKDGRDADFDPDKQLSWVKAFSWFLPFIQEHNLSVIGVLHAPKGKYAHGLPHSAKLGGYLWNWYCLYRKGRSMEKFPARWLAERFDGANKNTQMLFQGRERLGILKHWFYEYGDEVDRNLLNEKVDFVPRKLVNWSWQQEDDAEGGESEFDFTLGKRPSIPDGDGIMVKLSELGNGWHGRSILERKFNATDEVRKSLLFYRLQELVTAKRLECRDRNSGISFKIITH